MNDRPLPVTPAGTSSPALKCACADLWAHPVAQLLAGPALRPGGRDLTALAVDGLGLEPGARVLDVGSGAGTTLGTLAERAVRPFGVDYSPVLASQAADHAPVAVGDAEVLPFAGAAFDAVLLECVCSALPDKPAAIREARRVVRTGGRLVLTDVTLEGELPDPLRSVASWAACVGGALPAAGYEQLLTEEGFRPDASWDATPELGGLLDQAERRLAMLLGATGVGVLGDAERMFGRELDRLGVVVSPAGLSDLAWSVFAQAREAIVRGELGYAVVVATGT